jgi:hypothetical protein
MSHPIKFSKNGFYLHVGSISVIFSGVGVSLMFMCMLIYFICVSFVAKPG